jgi:hypothetical protein
MATSLTDSVSVACTENLEVDALAGHVAMRPAMILLVLLCLWPTSAVHAYDDCNGQIGGFSVSTPAGSVSAPHIADGTIISITDPATGPFYLDIRYVIGRQTSGSSTSVNAFSIWLYQEANNVSGLQRGDSRGRYVPQLLPGTPPHEVCNESYNPDQWIF